MTESDAKSVEHMRLVRLLRPLLVGCLVAVEVIVRGIWDQFVNRFVPTNAPRGDVGRFSNEDIAEAVGWQGDADQFIQAMVESGRLAKSDEHRLVVVDWSKIAPAYLRSNVKHKGGFIGAPDSGGRNEERNAPEVPQSDSDGTDHRNADHFDTRSDQANDSRNGERNDERDDAVYPLPSLPLPSLSIFSPPSPPASTDRTWGEVGEDLRKLGISRVSEALAVAQERGQSVEDVDALVDQWRQNAGAWGPGALFDRIVGKLAAWPPVDPKFRRQQQRQETLEAHQRVVADREAGEQRRRDDRARFAALDAKHAAAIDAMDSEQIIDAMGDEQLVGVFRRKGLTRLVRERLFEVLEQVEVV